MSLIQNLVARLRGDTAQFDKSMGKSRTVVTRFGKDVKNMGKQMLAMAGVGGGLYMVNRGMRSMVAAFIAQENAERSLIAATGASIESYKKFAAGIQKLTIYGDEQILSQMAYAKNLGVATDQLEDATTAAVGLAAKYRLDLATSMMLVGRASQGQTQMLTRYGIVLDQSLSAQEKFNAVLKIGAASFSLATEETKTLSGWWTQFKNNAGDMGEVVVGTTVDIVRGLADVADHYKGVEESAESAGEVMKRIKENMPSFQANMPGAFYYPVTPKAMLPDPNSPAGIMRQRRLDMEAEAKALVDAAKEFERTQAEVNNPLARAYELKTQAESIKKVMPEYGAMINKEIALTGLVGDARQHAAKMLELENKLKKEGVTNTKLLTIAMDAAKKKLMELKDAQQLARIAQDIGSAFADAFTDMIFEAKKFADVMKSLMKDIARSVVQNMITTPLAQSITMALGGTVPAGNYHTGGIVGRGGMTRNVPAMAFAGAPRLHGGLMGDEFPAILQRGETVIPKGGGGNAPTIIINNNSGQKMRQDGPAQFNGRDMIIQIVADDYQRGGQLRKMFQ